MSWSGCAGPKLVVIPADYMETRIQPGQTITATNGGVFMGWARYQQYRQAVANRIQEEQTR